MRHRRSCEYLNLVNLSSTHSVAMRALLSFAVMTASTIPVTLAAGSINAQLVVGVTVVRSCMVDAQPTSQTASRLKLSCAAGAIRGLQMNQGATRFNEGGAAVLLAPTVPASQTTSNHELRVLTLNF